jgi:hypothetical protein
MSFFLACYTYTVVLTGIGLKLVLRPVLLIFSPQRFAQTFAEKKHQLTDKQLILLP